MTKILLIDVDNSHISDMLLLHAMNHPLDIIPMESAPKVPCEPCIRHTFDIEPISSPEVYIPLQVPKKGIGEKAKLASKPHKRKRK